MESVHEPPGSPSAPDGVDGPDGDEGDGGDDDHNQPGQILDLARGGVDQGGYGHDHHDEHDLAHAEQRVGGPDGPELVQAEEERPGDGREEEAERDRPDRTPGPQEEEENGEGDPGPQPEGPGPPGRDQPTKWETKRERVPVNLGCRPGRWASWGGPWDPSYAASFSWLAPPNDRCNPPGPSWTAVVVSNLTAHGAEHVTDAALVSEVLSRAAAAGSLDELDGVETESARQTVRPGQRAEDTRRPRTGSTP